MSDAQRIQPIAATPQRLWEVIADPEHMPRWWPGVERMEGVTGDRFTQVLKTRRGKPVRIDFRVLESQPPWVRSWAQEIAGTPFERVLRESIVEVRLLPLDDGRTQVAITQRQKLRGYSRTGGLLLRRATTDKLAEALQNLAGICA